MKILRTKEELRQMVSELKADGKTVGLIPTMGALHEGHLSLVDQALHRGDTVVASVFVNPVQFNNAADLATYPRDEKADFEKLDAAGVTAVFAPAVSEMYPEGTDAPAPVFDLGSVAEVMEGRFRPGHFQGVARIVSMLLRLASPTRAYFGEKDFQQIAVIRRMTQTEGIDVEIVSCPIKRAVDGLALSSRNSLLTDAQRAVAPGIYRNLKYSVEYSRNHSVQATHDTVVEAINALEECRVEYFEIVDGITLQPVENWDDAQFIVGCITVYCGEVRLIDNITYRPLKD